MKDIIVAHLRAGPKCIVTRGNGEVLFEASRNETLIRLFHMGYTTSEDMAQKTGRVIFRRF